jgi:hypothetical protein
MVSAAHSAEVDRGADVARVLGWPTDRVGFLGALGGLIDIGAPMRRPQSLASLLVRRRADQARALEAHMREQRDLATRH